jgi:hypothetical protein
LVIKDKTIMEAIKARALTENENSYCDLIDRANNQPTRVWQATSLFSVLNKITADENLSIKETVLLIKRIANIL